MFSKLAWKKSFQAVFCTTKYYLIRQTFGSCFQAEILTGFPVTCVADARRATDVLLDQGCSTVIITLGEHGSVYATQADRQPQHVAARQVRPVDTTVSG